MKTKINQNLTLLNRIKKARIILLILMLSNCLYAQDGSLDLTFDSLNNISTSGSITSFATQSNGKIVITGRFTSINGINTNKIARLNVDGSLDTTFNVGSGLVLDPAYGEVNPLVIVQSDDKIIVSGKFTTFNGIIKNSIVRLNGDGTIDSTFNTGTGFKLNYPLFGGTYEGPGNIRHLKLNSNGQIVISGSFTKYNNIISNATKYITLLNSDGSLVTTFDAANSIGNVLSLEVQSDNKIVIALEKSTVFIGSPFLQNDYYLKRLNSNGSPDSSFTLNNTILCSSNIGGVPLTGKEEKIFNIKYLADEKLIVCGDFRTIFGNNNKSIARLNNNGTVDNIFSGGGVILNTTSYGIIYTTDIQSDNKIIIGGYFDSYNGINIKNIARINSNGTFDNTFNPGASTINSNIGETASISLLKILPNTKIITIGKFDSFNGVNKKSIARLNGQFSNFILSPNLTTIDCSLITPITFSIANVYNASGVLTYNWNVGNTWKYNGALAPNIINTSTNSITLTPNIFPISNISVIPTYNDVNQQQLNANISLPPFSSSASITGNTTICSGSSTYYISGIGTNTISWSISNTAIATITSANSTSVTLNKIGTGTVKLIATLVNYCNQTTSITKTINIGEPVLSGLISGPTCVGFNQTVTYSFNDSSNIGNVYEWSTDAPIDDNTSPTSPLNCSWKYITAQGSSQFKFVTGCIAGTVTIRVKINTSCGSSNYIYLYVQIGNTPCSAKIANIIQANGNYSSYFIDSEDKNVQPQKLSNEIIKVATIYSLNGSKIKEFKINEYDTSYLTRGTYILKIETKDEKIITSKIIIR